MFIARALFGLALGIVPLAAATAAEPLHVYGPGGPYPALKEAAEVFGKAHGIDVQVTAGPTGKWLTQAKEDADVIFSGSESMMSDFVTAFDGQIDPKTVTPLYLRPSAILVRPGNPGHITGLADLMKPGHKILVVNGSGQGGLWEDVVGRMGDIGSVKALRSNIGRFAATSADAKQTWTGDTSFDAWVIWNIWQVANPAIADLVAVEPGYRVYRDTGVALTQRGDAKPAAKEFATFLASAEGAKIFGKWGWTVPGARK
jgi:accessory colonization factor AcfC